MSGVSLAAGVITGIKAGIADSAGSLETTLNNQYLGEMVFIFVGFAVIVGLLMYMIKGHRKI